MNNGIRQCELNILINFQKIFQIHFFAATYKEACRALMKIKDFYGKIEKQKLFLQAIFSAKRKDIENLNLN